MSDQTAAQAPAPEPSGEEGAQSPARQEPQQRGRGRSQHRRHRQPPGQPQQQQQGRAARLEPSINLEELRELAELIETHGFTDFELEREGFRIRLSRNTGAATAPQATTAAHSQAAPAAAQPSQAAHAPQHPGAQAEAAASADEELHIITSPILGTFYRSPSPTAEPFVRIGSHVENDSVVCIIEAMKLMNEIQAEVSGEVAKIYVENGQPVEYGQPLFGIKNK